MPLSYPGYQTTPSTRTFHCLYQTLQYPQQSTPDTAIYTTPQNRYQQ